jgi:hypothetical protein
MNLRKRTKKRPVDMEVLKVMCGTCPFRPDSPHAALAEGLAESALNESSRVCHSTGSGNAINHRTGKPPALCRGARDIQLKAYHAIGFIEAATDEAWDKKCRELGLKK